jgi:hypothetical protein
VVNRGIDPRRSEQTPASDTFFRLIAWSLGLAAAAIYLWRWNDPLLQHIAIAVVAGLAMTSLSFIALSRSYEAHQARKREAIEKSKLIEYGLYKMAYGSLIIALAALGMSLYTQFQN